MKNLYATKPSTTIRLEDTINTITCKTDTRVNVLEGEGWSFQYAGRIPFKIQAGEEVYVPKGVTYKLIKGRASALIKVNED